MAELTFVDLKSVEKKRVYHFADRSIAIENVARVCIRPSGSHRLETTDGRKWIISDKWDAIELDVDNWSF